MEKRKLAITSMGTSIEELQPELTPEQELSGRLTVPSGYYPRLKEDIREIAVPG